MASKKKSTLDIYEDTPETLDSHPFFGITPDKEQKELIDAVWKREKKIFLVDSIAGSGKTLIATALGVLMVKYGIYDKVVYVTFPGIYEKTQGFLPGDLLEKSEPYFQPLYDALIEIGELPDHVCNTSIDAMENGTSFIECAVSTYMRGINLKKAFVIVDEAENADLQTLTKVLSRINDDCITMVIGHAGQCDMYDKSKSGFTACIDYQIHNHPEDCMAFNLLTNHRGKISQWADLMLEEYKEPQYGFIYMTKNNITGKLYIGQHRRTMDPKDIDDSWYFGSGKVLRKALVKYGMENFERNIIYECNSEEQLNYMEQVFIQYYNAVDDNMFYNLTKGGGGIKGYTFTEEAKEHMRHSHSPMSDDAKKHMVRILGEEARKKISISAKEHLTGYIHSEESKKNMSDSHKGSKSIYKDGIYKYVKESAIDEYLSEGWTLKGPQSGKKVPRKDTRKRTHIHKGKICQIVLEDTIQDYLDDGWKLGRYDVGEKVWIHNGVINKFIFKSELDNYTSNGWTIGKEK